VLYRLAEMLGMTVERILTEMTVTERHGWILYLEERAAEAEAAREAAPTRTIGRGARTTGNIMDMDPAAARAALEGRG